MISLADTESENIFPRKLTPEVLQALRGVRFIAQHIKDADKDNEVNVLFQIYFCAKNLMSPKYYERKNEKKILSSK